MILGNESLEKLLLQVMGHNDLVFINSASIDICIGNSLKCEIEREAPVYLWPDESDAQNWLSVDLACYSMLNPYWLQPGDFVNVSTLENIKIPNDLVMNLFLKSTRARQGYEHSLAFWVDPGWQGILTMEICNRRRYVKLPLYPGMRIAQTVLQRVEGISKGYEGKYQNAAGVESAKL